MDGPGTAGGTPSRPPTDTGAPRSGPHRHRTPPNSSRVNLVLWLLLAILLASRLMWLHADPSGPYINTDEGHQNSDARSLVLHGTAFYDTYNPCVLMPVFTLVKALPLWLFGVNLAAVRLPSVFASALAVFLVARLLARRGESLAAILLMVCTALSFYDFSHARIGNHEPLLQLCMASGLLLLHRGIETRRVGFYLAAVPFIVSAPLIKTSGVFVFGAAGLTVGYTALFRRGKLRRAGVVSATVAGVVLAAAVVLLWFRPNADEVCAFYSREVLSKRTPSTAASLGLLLRLAWRVTPFSLAAGALSAARFTVRTVRCPRRNSTLDVVLFSWLAAGVAPLVYSAYLPPRFFMWVFLPLNAMAVRELVGWLRTRPVRRLRAQWLPAAAASTLCIASAARDAHEFVRYFDTKEFYVHSMSETVEEWVGEAVVSGSGFCDFAAASDELNLVSCFHYSALATQQDIRRAFPTSTQQPDVLSIHVGGDAAGYSDALDAFYSTCTEWKSKYVPVRRLRRINPPGTWDLWLVRRDTDVASLRRLLSNRAEGWPDVLRPLTEE